MSNDCYRYELLVVDRDDGCTAYLGGEDSPLRGYGSGPLEAVRALCETIREWPISGAEAWLSTPPGIALARVFVPDFKPGGGKASA